MKKRYFYAIYKSCKEALNTKELIKDFKHERMIFNSSHTKAMKVAIKWMIWRFNETYKYSLNEPKDICEKIDYILKYYKS